MPSDKPVRGGSSPLTRGKRCGLWGGRRRGGLIPAHAGKTSRCFIARVSRAAHPRSRGENGIQTAVQTVADGSSPLTRGKHKFKKTLEFAGGLIPAHAGKTSSRPRPRRAGGAHPRSRGENNNLDGAAEVTPGSSPLTRGKHRSHERGNYVGGLIPAHAGKTIDIACTRPLTRAHPRSRGENSSRPR